MVLSVEFSGRDHPVGRTVEENVDRILVVVTDLITAGRDRGQIPQGPPDRWMALALLGAIEELVINLAGQEGFDEELAERAARGVLGVRSAPPSII